MIQQIEKISSQELRKISLEFRSYSSRLLRTKYQNGISNLRRFVNFIDNNQLISSFIKIKVKEADRDFSDIDLATENIPSDGESNEIKFIYLLLKKGLNTQQDEEHGYWHIACNYSQSSRNSTIQGNVDSFNSLVVHPFVEYIGIYLTRLQIDLGKDEQNNTDTHNYYSGGAMSIENSKSQFSIGGSIGGNINNVQGDNNNVVQGDNIQAVLGDGNQVNQSEETIKTLTKTEIIQLLTELELLVKEAALPSDTKAEAIEDLISAKTAIDKEDPNKKRALERLTTVTEALEKTSKSLDAGQKIWQIAKPIILKIAHGLGAVAGSSLLGLF